MAGGCNGGNTSAATPDITVFAAASTADVITEAATQFEAKTGTNVIASFDASSTLAKQIIAGAAVDVFLSADQKWMDEVAAAGSVQAGSRADLLANQLVMIVPKDEQAFDVEFSRDRAITAQAPHVRRIAIADPSHVPAGRYAKQAFESLGWWGAAEPLLVPALDVRAALRLVEIGEAELGIVYATDAMHSNGVMAIATIPSELHEPITYPIAACSPSAAAAEFIAFLQSDDMRRVFEGAGFRVIAAAAPAGAPH